MTEEEGRPAPLAVMLWLDHSI